jgi:hypothetical protein
MRTMNAAVFPAGATCLRCPSWPGSRPRLHCASSAAPRPGCRRPKAKICLPALLCAYLLAAQAAKAALPGSRTPAPRAIS